jgi:phosphatidate cytidylyltransferase
MSNFWARTITGLSMVFLLLAAMVINYWFFSALFLLVTILGLIEFYRLFSSDEIQPQIVYGTLAGALLFVGMVLQPFCIISPVWLLPLVFLPFVFEVFRKKSHPFLNIALTLTGILYLAVPLGLLVLINDPSGIRLWGFPVLLTGILLFTWLYDTGAYLFGKQFGKTLFFERISPKKTWEGIAAGTITAWGAAVAMIFLVPEIAWFDWMVLATIVVVFGTLGDLAESMLKRSLNIKDSGSILPGHGGILDRFDSFLISIPFVFLYLVLRTLI